MSKISEMQAQMNQASAYRGPRAVRGLLVYASGKTEELPYPGGRTYIKEETCSECGTHKKTRLFEVHWAHETDDANAGTLVYIEVPA